LTHKPVTMVQTDYISVVYEQSRTPKTDYPRQLVAYLMDRFGLKAGDHLLEVGCGRGDFLLTFHDMGLRCAGVDVEGRSNELLPGLDVRQCDVSKELLPFGDDTFDVVYHKSLIEHLYSPENLMEETYRVLKPGGVTIILTPDWVSQMKVFYEDFTHCRPYDVTSLRDLLTIKGFSSVHTELFYQLPVVWRFPSLKILCKVPQLFVSTPKARKLTQTTGIKFFRWSVELMVLGYGKKQ